MAAAARRCVTARSSRDLGGPRGAGTRSRRRVRRDVLAAQGRQRCRRAPASRSRYQAHRRRDRLGDAPRGRPARARARLAASSSSSAGLVQPLRRPRRPPSPRPTRARRSLDDLSDRDAAWSPAPGPKFQAPAAAASSPPGLQPRCHPRGPRRGRDTPRATRGRAARGAPPGIPHLDGLAGGQRTDAVRAGSGPRPSHRRPARCRPVAEATAGAAGAAKKLRRYAAVTSSEHALLELYGSKPPRAIALDVGALVSGFS